MCFDNSGEREESYNYEFFKKLRDEVFAAAILSTCAVLTKAISDEIFHSSRRSQANRRE